MDLENELRQAMAEHVTGVSAARTLADEARRRHHRTVRRRTTLAVAAAGIIVVGATVPTYQAFRPQTVGQRGPATRHTTGTEQSATATARPSVSAGDRPGSPPERPAGSPRPTVTRSSHSSGAHETVPDVAHSLLGYLPPGIGHKDTCHTDRTGQRKVMTCRWTGSAGSVEVRVVHDATLASPADLGFASAVVKHVSINGHSALRCDGPAALSQVMWIEHDGLGVWVGVSPNLSGRLMKVAESVHAH